MRDIRPAGRSRHSDNEEWELYEASNAIKHSARQPLATGDKRTRLAGQKVPVTNIHAPRAGVQTHSDADHEPARKRTRAATVRVGGSERRLLLAFFGLVVLASGLAAWLFLPTAAVVLHLRTAPLLVDQELTLGTSSEGVPAIPGTVLLREVAITGSSKVEHTETIGAKAAGAVTIVNRSSGEQKIKESSRLTTKGGRIFFMQQAAFVPPNGRVTVPVEAAEAGAEGNLEAQRLDFAALDAASQQILFAEVTDSLSGGSGEIVSVVSDDDIVRAKQAAGGAARTQVESDMRGELPEGWALLEESWTGELKAFEATPAVGEASPEISYTAKVNVRVMGFEQQQLRDRLRSALEERLDEAYMLFPGPISYTKSVRDVDWERAAAVISVRVTHTTIPRLSLDTLREKLAGRSAAEAQSYLEGLPGVRSAEINVWPFWVRSVPQIGRRISLQLEPERQP